MPTLTVIYKGHEVSQITLNPDQEIWIGRDSKNDIVLDAPYGISRKHLKIFQTEEQKWKVQCESSIGGLLVDSKEVTSLILEDQTIFFLQEFKFSFNISSDSNPKELKSQQSFHSEEDNGHFKGASPESEDSQNSEPQNKRDEDLEESSFDSYSPPSNDKTVISSDINLQAQIVISLPDNEDVDEQTVILKDQLSWIIGREVSCDICIEDRAISREHIKIEKKNSEYFVTDLKSSNGTILNEEKLKAKQPYTLKSGDVLKVLDIKIYFDIVNLAFKENELNLPVFSSSPEEPDSSNLPISNVVMDETKITSQTSTSSSKKRFFFIFGVLVLTIGGFLFFESSSEKSDSENVDENSLSLEDQERIQDMYMVAQQLYQTKKYELCITKIEELHILSITDQSIALQQKCISGQETLISQMEIKKQKEEQEKIQKIISENTEECTRKFSTFTSEEEIRDCLAPTLNHDPENFIVTELISRFEVQEFQRIERQQAQAIFKRKIDTEIKIYNQALALKEKGDTLKAIEAYKNFLKRKHPEAIQETVEKARQELQTMETELNQALAQFMNDCERLLGQKKI